MTVNKKRQAENPTCLFVCNKYSDQLPEGLSFFLSVGRSFFSGSAGVVVLSELVPSVGWRRLSVGRFESCSLLVPPDLALMLRALVSEMSRDLTLLKSDVLIVYSLRSGKRANNALTLSMRSSTNGCVLKIFAIVPGFFLSLV